jgi:hypothetical protein
VALGQHEDDDASAQAKLIREMVDNFSTALFRPLCLLTNDLQRGPFNVGEGNCRAVALEILRQRREAPFSELAVFIATSGSATVRVWQ